MYWMLVSLFAGWLGIVIYNGFVTAESAYDQLRQLRNQTLDETEDERKESKTYKSKK